MSKLIVIAEEGERNLIAKHLPQWADTPVRVTGVGAINIIRSLQDVPRDTEIINIGYCGSANYEIGSLVMVGEARLNHPNVTYPEPILKLQPIQSAHGEVLNVAHDNVVCYSNTDFVLQSDYKDCIFDMELAYIAALGFTHLSSVKIVSDNLSLHAYHELTNGVE